MGWWGSGRSGPRSRREMQAAYSILAEESVRVRGDLGRARLDNVQLGATVEALGEAAGALRAELANLRSELAALRANAAGPDPVLMLFAGQNAEMRGQLAENQRTITELTSRLTDLLELHLQAEAVGRPVNPVNPVPSVLRPTGRRSTGSGDAVHAAPAMAAPITDLREPDAGAAGDRLRLIRRALDG